MTLLCSKLKQSPEKVDYLNISTSEDTLQYMDPNLIETISNRETGEIRSLAVLAKQQIDSFFYEIVEIHRNKLSTEQKLEKFELLFAHFSEPHHLRLGFSKEGNSGKGTTAEELIKIFMNDDIVSIILNKDGLTIPQKMPLIKNFGDDKLSDLTSNIIMNVIINFNKYILLKYPEMKKFLSANNVKYHYFSTDGIWEECVFTPFLFDNKETLLVPKLFTTYNQTSSLSLMIRVYIEEEITKLQIKNNSPQRMTKKDYTKQFIKGNRIDNTIKIFLETSLNSHEKFKKELSSKANERRNHKKENN